MKNTNKKGLYIILLLLSLTFIALMFVLEKPDGILGFILFLISLYTAIGSLIKLCKISQKFKNNIINILDLLFWLP